MSLVCDLINGAEGGGTLSTTHMLIAVKADEELCHQIVHLLLIP